VKGVLCADGHLGYAHPIGGVVAYANEAKEKLLGVPPIVVAVAIIAAVAMIARFAKPRSDMSSSWALALSCTLVFNLYVGVYDTILLIPSVLLMYRSLSRQPMLLLAIWMLPWVSGLIARETGVQLFTLAMFALVICQMRERAWAVMTDKCLDDARFNPTSHEDAAPATGAHPALA
jgi:hypothetical protein